MLREVKQGTQTNRAFKATGIEIVLPRCIKNKKKKYDSLDSLMEYLLSVHV